MGLGEIFGSIGLGNFGLGQGGLTTLIMILLVALISLSAVGGVVFFVYRWKQWNLKVLFRLPRAVKYLKDGEEIDVNNIQGTIDSEIGKGSFRTKKGAVYLKRSGMRKCSMKPFKIDRYLQGSNFLEVTQIAPETYIPTIPESYLLVEDDLTGETAVLSSIKADMSDSKAWKNSYERQAKNTFSIMDLLNKYALPISIGLVIFLWGIQFMIIYTKIK